MRASKLPMPGVRRPFHYGLIILLCLVFDGFFGLQAKDYGGFEQQRVETIFPGSDGLSEPDGEFKVRTMRTGKEVLGYVFQSQNVVDIPAYSGNRSTCRSSSIPTASSRMPTCWSTMSRFC